MLALVLGGARSGKSEVAERLASRQGLKVICLAPGQAFDSEMTERIRLHRERRDPTWTTVEEPIAIAEAVRRHGRPDACFLLDGLGAWVSNLMLAEVPEDEILQRVDELLDSLRGTPSIIVSDEVGLGVIPSSSLGRQFRDCLGRANRAVAARADRALLVVAGIPVDLKALEASL